MREDLLFDRPKSFFFIQEEEGAPLLYKVFKNESPTPHELASFYNEYIVLRPLNLPGVRKVLRKDRVQGNYALVFEYIPGEPLSNYHLDKNLGLRELLHIALSGAKILADVHTKQLIHHDIKPSNFIYDSSSKDLNLIDFGLAASFEVNNPHLATHEKLKGSLPYISPEQTGRMNRKVDFRSDLYSFGGTLYHLLIGKPPFWSEDPLELVHFHIAKEPEPPAKINPQIPEVLSRLVIRLLAKNAEDRYQSAQSLAKDLQTCIDKFDSLGHIPDFPLSSNDHSIDFLISEKLYGREKELSQLMREFEEIKNGGCKLILIEGASGVGKSSLVKELERPISLQKGTLLQGRFDPLQRNIPYFALIEAINDFCDGLNASDTVSLIYWKDKILQGVGKLGRLMIELVPALKPILGEQPQIPELQGVEARHRLKYVFRNFIQAICSHENPLLLFLDDIQWADSASLEVLVSLLKEQQTQYLILVCAFREEELDKHHPFHPFLNEVEDNFFQIRRLSLNNLTESECTQLTADALHQSPSKAKDLAKLIYQKTRGNPFYTKEFLKKLHQNNALIFHSKGGWWSYEFDKAKKLAASDNISDFLLHWIQSMPEQAQLILQAASCIGNEFTLDNLIQLTREPFSILTNILERAASEGVISPKDNTYRLAAIVESRELAKKAHFYFVHERLREAIYSMMSPLEQNQTHLKAARELFQTLSPQELDKEIFTLINQYNSGQDLIEDTDEFDRLLRLNTKAADKANKASAFATARTHYKIIVSLIEQKKHHANSTELLDWTIKAAENAFLNNELPEALLLTEKALRLTGTKQERVKALFVKIRVLMSEDELDKAIQAALEALHLMEVPFPRKPRLINVIWGMIQTRLTLRGRNVESLAKLPLMQDADQGLVMRLIELVTPAAFRSQSNFFPLFVFKQVQISLQNGNSAQSLFAYAAYGIAMCATLGDYDQGYRFGKLCFQLIDQVPKGQNFYAHISFIFNNFIRHWTEPIDSYEKDFLKGYQKGLESGAIFEAAWTAHYRTEWAWLHGTNLQQTLTLQDSFLGTINQDKAAKDLASMLRQTIECLQGKTPKPTKLIGNHYDERRNYHHSPTEMGMFHFRKLLLHHLFEEPFEAHHHLKEIQRYIQSLSPMPIIPLIHFYGALVRLRLYRQRKEKGLLRLAKKDLTLLTKWAKRVPQTHRHRQYLVEAELARSEGRNHHAHECYDRAMQRVRSGKNQLEEALIFEYAAEFYHESGQLTFTKPLVQQTLSLYEQWGAAAKTEQLRTKFNKILVWQKRISNSPDEESRSTTNTSSNNKSLDLLAVVRASQVISGEIHLNQLKSQLLKTVMEMAGAQRVCLLLERQGQFWVEADNGMDQMKNANFQPCPILGFSKLPQSILHYVTRTRNDVVLAEAINEKKFEKDPYIQEAKPLSLLCIPISHYGNLSGILYLENNLVAGAFTQQHLEIVRLISSQVAISMENAMLYQTVEQKVNERTNELNNALDDVRQKNTQIQSSIGYARNIQGSLLPEGQALNQSFREHFILYEPRDVIGGDIYLIEPTSEGTCVAVLDCTGHGVPGAFMTMIAGSAFKQILKSEHRMDPATILKELHRVIRTSLNQEQAKADDGLDGGICLIEKNKLIYSGARFPLLYQKKGQIHAIKGDRQSIGYRQHQELRPFTNHEIQIEEGMTFYLATDGIWDQTGLPKGFSYGERRFRNFLQSIQQIPLAEQKQLIQNELVQFQGFEERKDDITVLAFRP